ncbi:hypothetical protein [Aurantimonas sp. Leaf443]|uniref:hypothetical protein n=1 Tax=Aurantimonas sp. Leaf443 TaxID=1736378 RepID=UPI0006FB7BB0|nr:hypothetical protein [Aurantimonas sp. Leaf443]KQT88163.1 hypothetical protein ASG48_01585 [Aurantimonas sp. Leaf443]
MIATGLIFLLGFCVALIAALIAAPLVVRRAKRLARREFDATLPATAREIRASLDQVRAEAALEVRRREVAAMEMRERAALERADAGRIARENALLRSQERLSGEAIRMRDEAFADLARRHEERGAEIAELQSLVAQADRAIEQLTLEVAALSQGRVVEIVELGDEDGETARESLGDADEGRSRAPKALPVPVALRAPEAEPAAEPRRAPDSDEAPAPEAADPIAAALGYRAGDEPLSLAQDDASLRESVSDMAARMLALASREGPASERIREILASAPQTPEADGAGGRSLADRARDHAGAQAGERQPERLPQ